MVVLAKRTQVLKGQALNTVRKIEGEVLSTDRYWCLKFVSALDVPVVSVKTILQ